MTDSTTFEKKCGILSELYIASKHDPDWDDFREYNDVGLPLAHLIASDIVKSTPKAQIFVEQTFAGLLEAVGVVEDIGFESLDEILGWQPED
jgi:hypothetical protein